ncbi:MAG: YerC/YecD family TrpR-related protein [Oscillospiraceae bacterium]|nr:YerC/YecD family TrpR-related protein [Oscillospiraceae bacterium]
MKKNKHNMDILYKALLSLKDEKECEAFLEDLCTPQELDAMAQRLSVAVMLNEGAVYNKIVTETGASTATISRVNKTLTYQTAGGYEIVLGRIKNNV